MCVYKNLPIKYLDGNYVISDRDKVELFKVKVFPILWKISTIILVFKPNKPTNTTFFAKILEKLGPIISTN